MPCLTSKDGTLTVCSPTVVDRRVRVLYCPKCKQKRRVLVYYYEWYGPSATCTAKRLKWAHFEKCGYVWQWE